MEGLLDWGADINRALEEWRPTFDAVFHALTTLGEIQFFFVFLAAMYWLVDRDLAVRITILLAASTLINVWLKDAFGQPRPAAHDPALSPLLELDSPGFPSGHAQSAVVIWGSIFAAFRRPWIRLVSVCAMVLVPFSRLYLGVHFPHDLVGGFILGAVLLWAGARLVPPMIDRFLSLTVSAQLMLAMGLPIAGTLLANNPGGLRGGAAFAGGFVGLVMERHWIRCSPVSGWPHRARRLIVGFTGVAVLWWLGFGDLGLVANSLGLLLIAVWIAAGAPWVFERLERRGTRHPPLGQTV